MLFWIRLQIKLPIFRQIIALRDDVLQGTLFISFHIIPVHSHLCSVCENMNCGSTLVTPRMMFSCVNTCLRFARLTKNVVHFGPHHSREALSLISERSGPSKKPRLTWSITFWVLVCYDPSTSTTMATSYLYILFAITFKLVCILILKRTSNHIFGPGSWLCVNAGGEELFDVVMAGRLPPQYYWICRPLSCPKVLCWLLFWLYYQQRKREGEN